MGGIVLTGYTVVKKAMLLYRMADLLLKVQNLRWRHASGASWRWRPVAPTAHRLHVVGTGNTFIPAPDPEEAEGVAPVRRVLGIGSRVGSATEPQRVDTAVSSGCRIVVSRVVVVQPGFRVVVLPLEPPWCAGSRRQPGQRLAPDRGFGMPREGSRGIDQLGSRADDVSDYRVELAVYPLLRRVLRPHAFDLHDGPVAVGVPVPGGRGAPAGLLLGHHRAIPMEGDLLGDARAVAVQPLLGDAAAEWVIHIAPAGAVGRHYCDQPTFRVPSVVPGVGTGGQPFSLSKHDAPFGVIPVPNVAGLGQLRSGVGPRLLRALGRRVA